MDSDEKTSTVLAARSRHVDEALAYLESHHEEAVVDDAMLRKIRRKIDWHIFPCVCACHMVQNLDKYALNYAAVMGLRNDLNLQGNDFSNVATLFFVAYIVAEIPNIYLLQRLPAAKWFGFNVFIWGIATACTAATTDYASLLAVRILLGIFEATTMPSSQTITAQWFTKTEAPHRYAYWYFGNAGAQIVGGLASFGFQHVEHASLRGWRLMFLVFGVITVVIGIATALFVPDTPMEAKFLSEAEKVALIKHVSVNRTGIRNHRFRPQEIWEAARDPQIVIFLLPSKPFTLTQSQLASSSGIITTYSATLIKNMGYTSKQAALLNMPGGLVSLTIVFAAAAAIRNTPGGHRWFWISACALLASLGAALTSFLPPSPSHKPGLLVGIWLINAITPTLPLMYHYASVNVSGHTKRSFAANAIAVGFGLGNIVGPQMFRAQDAPVYRGAKIGTLGTEAGTAVCVCVLAFWYRWENGRRGRVTENEAEDRREESGNEGWEGLTDWEDRGWRYCY
ncbi:putative MFS transporter [Polyplosphaeria fusca]|uniref:MFS transporter n=1 Tax=Polyplosphaeria fusca TaxID=682080 RepID=A0A9P4UXA8_9PLEO|nr:putative MFS transporter [Polyplosphaeria fusca]